MGFEGQRVTVFTFAFCLLPPLWELEPTKPRSNTYGKTLV